MLYMALADWPGSYLTSCRTRVVALKMLAMAIVRQKGVTHLVQEALLVIDVAPKYVIKLPSRQRNAPSGGSTVMRCECLRLEQLV